MILGLPEERIRQPFFKYLYGAYGTGYTDGVRMDYVRFLNERTGGWLFKSGGNGDGYYFNQIFGPKIHLWKCAGGEIRNVVGGWIKLEECFNVSVDNWHSENDGADGVPTANLWLEDTHAVVRNCWFYDNWNTDAVYPIYIRDSDTLYNHTNVTIEDCVFLNAHAHHG